MPQVFHRSANSISRVSIFVILFGVAALIAAAYGLDRGNYNTDVRVAKDQPIPFSHKHHVTDDGIDCRYCHTSVETAPYAGIPATEICMSCHSQIWSNATMLEPLRESFRTGQSIAWTRVHDLPEFVYFNHSIHLKKGIGCATCHGRVDKMPLMMKVNTLNMNWCVECHRNPEKYIRPREEVFNMAYEAPSDQLTRLGPELVKEYHVQKLEDCYTCHR
jgi:formamidopyrimidine-DNA glycosylase